MRRLTGALAVAVLAAACAARAEADEIELAGEEQYLLHCGVCHGIAGHGDGPLASLLRTAPPDLTRLAARNGGTFPFWRAYETIDGRALPGPHGTRRMPAWGPLLDAESGGGASATLVRGRILELLVYLRSLQRP